MELTLWPLVRTRDIDPILITGPKEQSDQISTTQGASIGILDEFLKLLDS